MLIALLWGLVQGLTEFLPISSSGHLILVPAVLGLPPPDLATSAVLHLGTLLAVIAYYRADLARLLRFRTDPEARQIIVLLAIGTVPAAVFGLAFEGPLGVLFVNPQAAAGALVGTGVILLMTRFLPAGEGRLEEASPAHAFLVGLAQALALVPGISRSGTTIAAALGLRMEPVQAARFSFLLAVPAIAGAGLLEALQLGGAGRFDASVWAGLGAATLSGYLAIGVLLRVVHRFGIHPFAWYCLGAGTVGLFLT